MVGRPTATGDVERRGRRRKQDQMRAFGELRERDENTSQTRFETRKREATLTLEGVVDEPLESGEGTDHEDTGTETGPETTETDLGVDRSDRGLGLSSLEGSVEPVVGGRGRGSRVV